MQKLFIGLMGLVSLFSISALSSQISNGRSAQAKVFNLKMDLSIEGKLIFSPSLTVNEGETATITEEHEGRTHFIEVVAKESKGYKGKRAVHMAFVVGKVAKDGTRTLISSPQIISALNEKAQITVGEDAAPELISLSVVASEASSKQ